MAPRSTQRRDFLRAGVAVGGSVGLGTAGCGAVRGGLSGVPVPSLAELQALDIDGFLRGLDSSLGYLQSAATPESLVSKQVQRSARVDPRFERADDNARKMIRSLLLVGSFGDLPEAGRAHPGVQARLWSSMQEMDDAVFGIQKMLTSLAPTERADIRRLMREDAAAGPRILSALDDQAVTAGVSARRREHMQDVGRHACFRLRQSTSLFIDEYNDKVKRVAERDAGAEAVQRRLMAQLGEQAFWNYHTRQVALAQAWQQVPGIAASAIPSPPQAAPSAGPLPGGRYVVYPYPQDPRVGATPASPAAPTLDANGRNVAKVKRANNVLGAGAGMLGLAVVIGGITALVVATGAAANGAVGVVSAVGLTVGALLGIAGVVCLIVGGILRLAA